MLVEEWKQIEIDDVIYDYEVSTEGNVRNMKTGRILKPQTIHTTGYSQVYLSKNGKIRWYKIHRLVATMFIPNPNEYGTVNHINHNKADNRVCNLEWMSIENNVQDANEKKVRCIETGKIYDSIVKASKDTGISTTSISGCCRGEREAVKGYHWEYV